MSVEVEVQHEPTPHEPVPHVVPTCRALFNASDWDACMEEVGDGLIAVNLCAPTRCAASRIVIDAFERARLDPAFATAHFATVDIDAAEEHFVTSRGLVVAPTLQFFKSGYMLTQFRGGDEIRLRSELTRLLAALRL